MAVPKRRNSHRRTATRKAQWLGALSAPAVTTCKSCGEPVMTYRACPSCGMYRGRQVVAVSSGEEEARG